MKLAIVTALSLSLVLGAHVLGCSAASQDTKIIVPVVETVLTDIEKACVIATMFDAVNPPVAADIAVACGIDASLVKLIEAEMPVGAATRAKLFAIEMAKPVGARRFGK